MMANSQRYELLLENNNNKISILTIFSICKEQVTSRTMASTQPMIVIVSWTDPRTGWTRTTETNHLLLRIVSLNFEIRDKVYR